MADDFRGESDGDENNGNNDCTIKDVMNLLRSMDKQTKTELKKVNANVRLLEEKVK